jgi:tRNA threonylcarbamoyladenosine biosynthesis protein TsaB
MPTILAIETASELASVALLYHHQSISLESNGVQTHSHAILPMVQRVLAQAGVTLAQCDAIAFGVGPGSFTGVRTACGIAQGLAFGLNLPVIPISTLQAMAQACQDSAGMSNVVTLLDARMGEVYWAQYRYEAGWQTLIEPVLSAPANVLPVDWPGNEVTICGNGLSMYAAEFNIVELPGYRIVQGVMPHAVQVAQLGHLAFLQGHTVAARDAQPLYLRNKVALTTNERMIKSAKASL